MPRVIAPGAGDELERTDTFTDDETGDTLSGCIADGCTKVPWSALIDVLGDSNGVETLRSGIATVIGEIPCEPGG